MIFSKPSVYIRIEGGLGNQLFQYAAARIFAHRTRSVLIIDNKSGFESDFVYKQICHLDSFNVSYSNANSISFIIRYLINSLYFLRKQIARNLNHPGFDFWGLFIVEIGHIINEKLLNSYPKRFVILDGYWQSYIYFNLNDALIRNDLKLNISDVSDLNQSLFNSICLNQSICVHIRNFNNQSNLDLDEASNLSINYYITAVLEMKKRLGTGLHFYIFSNHTFDAVELLDLMEGNYTLINNNNSDLLSIFDFWLMTYCKHFIISNSTFSWWSAWLAEFNQKLIIAPKLQKLYGRGQWGFDHLLPKDWVLL